MDHAEEEDDVPPFDGASWNPPMDAIESSSWGNGDDEPVVRVLTHPGAPYLQTAANIGLATMFGIAYDYIVAVTRLDIQPGFEIEPTWLVALRPDAENADPHFGWMELRDPDADSIQTPLGSLDATVGGDNLVVLFASERIGTDLFFGSEFGLRVALRWSSTGGKHHFSIIGISAVLPFGPYKITPFRTQSNEARIEIRSFLLSEDRKDEMAELANLDGDSVWLRGVRVAELGSGALQVERHGIGVKRGLDGSPTPYVLTTLTMDERNGSGVLLNRSEFFADAGGYAKVLEHAPPPGRADRPRRDDTVLDGRRKLRAIKPGASKPPLAYEDNLRVLPCPRFVRADTGAPTPIEVPLPDNDPPRVRSNTASAVQGLWFGRDFLRRMKAYGLDPTTYFELINPKIDIAYRSGVSPGAGKDGQSVNARVLPIGWPPDFIGPVLKADLPVVQVHLSLADRVRRERAHWNPGDDRAPAIPLGIAADERWLWHEFGHILTLAATGELELRFAHSPGDALAAIVGDPELEQDAASSQWRGATFPWVYLPRRHDRCVRGGWSWCGSMHKSLAQVPATEHPRRKGYLSEQILSSTLFRLYRCIGGDTIDRDHLNQPDREVRRRASHYTCFLVMKALKILGDAKVVPAMSPLQLQLALFEADVRQVLWSASYPPGHPAYTRVGGCSTKVIRWAFEAQGLHAPPGSGHDHNAIGVPRPVDIYIKSLRPTFDLGLQSAVDFGEGSYVPTSLHWQRQVADETPRWQADPIRGIVWRPVDEEIDVFVKNRGQATATGVRVRVWAAEWPAAQDDPPDWQGGAGLWVPCLVAPYPSKPIAPHASERFGPFSFSPVQGRRYIVVAVASCPSDRALVTRFNHACSFMPTRLVDIVPNDNNMGLMLI